MVDQQIPYVLSAFEQDQLIRTSNSCTDSLGAFITSKGQNTISLRSDAETHQEGKNEREESPAKQK